YVEQDNLYKQWNLARAFHLQNQVARETPVKIYFCPSRRAPGTPPVSIDTMDNTTTPANGAVADYAVCVGDPTRPPGTPSHAHAGNDYWFNPHRDGTPVVPQNGMFRMANDWGQPGNVFVKGHNFGAATDGLSNTILAGEKHVQLGRFGQPGAGDG